MADSVEEDAYESDPEQSNLSLQMRRRREASDDEDDDDNDNNNNDSNVRVRVSDYESDGQGAAADYDNDEDEEEEEVESEVVVKEVKAEGNIDGVVVVDGVYVKEEEESVGDGNDEVDGGEGEGGGGEGEGEKKENEPFAVPTAGAFYMHDDRFRDSAGARNRRTLGGKKLWELRDDSKWGHDKFEEMTGHDRRYNERRRGPRGRNRGRGRNQGEGRGLPKNYRTDGSNNNNNNQMSGPKSVRGRGPRRYQPSTQNDFEVSSESRQPAKPMGKNSHASSGRASAATSASESSQAAVTLVASNLNSASPPFYPSGSSTKETNLTQKRDAQSGSLNRGQRSPAIVDNYPVSQSNILRGRNVSASLGMDKLHIDDSISKPLNNLQTRSDGRGPVSFGQMAYQPVPHHHINRRNPPPVQQYRVRSASGSRTSSPPKPSGPAHVLESVELESSTESNDPKSALIGKGKGSIPSSGMSSFSYGDQNLSGAPTFLPVMQFAGQHHPRGLGVPAVGMAFPGYVAQPNGMGNSEMTWLPVLAGAAGALGAAGLGSSYPYISMDGAYSARPPGQLASLAPLINKDNSMNKSSGDVKPSQKPELEKDELRQRQNKARRYTEMKFDM